jgi:hypothetical protein
VTPPWVLRRCLLTALSAALLSGALAAGPAQADDPGAASAAVTFSDTFDGPAGQAADSAKWQPETGDNVSDHERQYYTAGNANAALDGQGHLMITARRENPGGYQRWYGTCEYSRSS